MVVYHRRGCGWPAGGTDEDYSSCRANKQTSSKQSQQSKPKYRLLGAKQPLTVVKVRWTRCLLPAASRRCTSGVQMQTGSGGWAAAREFRFQRDCCQWRTLPDTPRLRQATSTRTAQQVDFSVWPLQNTVYRGVSGTTVQRVLSGNGRVRYCASDPRQLARNEGKAGQNQYSRCN